MPTAPEPFQAVPFDIYLKRVWTNMTQMIHDRGYVGCVQDDEQFVVRARDARRECSVVMRLTAGKFSIKALREHEEAEGAATRLIVVATQV